MRIIVDDLTSEQVRALLALHMAGMREISPPESVHALDLTTLRSPDVTVWTAWEHDTVLGIGALKMLSAYEAEVKSMRTSPAALGRGVGRAVLDVIVSTARERGVTRLLLETGTTSDFTAAHHLYASSGFVERGPFGDYANDPFSRYYALDLAP